MVFIWTLLINFIWTNNEISEKYLILTMLIGKILSNEIYALSLLCLIVTSPVRISNSVLFFSRDWNILDSEWLFIKISKQLIEKNKTLMPVVTYMLGKLAGITFLCYLCYCRLKITLCIRITLLNDFYFFLKKSVDSLKGQSFALNCLATWQFSHHFCPFP